MTKTIIISTLLIVIIVILTIIAVRQPTTIVTKPVQQEIPEQRELTPRAPVVKPELPTQKHQNKPRHYPLESRQKKSTLKKTLSG